MSTSISLGPVEIRAEARMAPPPPPPPTTTTTTAATPQTFQNVASESTIAPTSLGEYRNTLRVVSPVESVTASFDQLFSHAFIPAEQQDEISRILEDEMLTPEMFLSDSMGIDLEELIDDLRNISRIPRGAWHLLINVIKQQQGKCLAEQEGANNHGREKQTTGFEHLTVKKRLCLSTAGVTVNEYKLLNNVPYFTERCTPGINNKFRGGYSSMHQCKIINW